MSWLHRLINRSPDLWLVVGVGTLALAVRLLYLLEVRDVALLAVPLADARAYLDWAGQITAGDWWGREIGAFYQAPLYPYFLAVVQTLAGEAGQEPDRTLHVVRGVQIIFGALSCALLALTGRRLWGRRCGLAAGLILAFYPPAIFFDGLINKVSLGQLLACLLLFLLAARVEAGRTPEYESRIGLLAGVCLGLWALVRENALLLAPILAVWWWLDTHLGNSRRRGAAAFALGLVLILLPVALRNAWVGGTFALTTAQAGPNFYIGNRTGATGSYTPLREGRSDTRFERRDAVELAEADLARELTSGEVSDYWFGRAWSDIHDDPLAWIRLMGRKTVLLVHRYEMPDIEDFYLVAERSFILRWLSPWLHLGTLLPLAMVGVVLTWSERRRLLPFALVFVGLAAGVVLFYIFARYRYPIVPVATFFAGAGLVRGAATVRAKGHPRWIVAVGVLIVAAVVSNWPVASILGSDPGASRAMAQVNAGAALAEQRRYDEAVEHYQRATELDPKLIEARLNLGSTLLFLGRLDEALEHLEVGVELAPQDPEAHHQLGQTWRALAAVRADREALENARHHFARAVELDPDFVQASRDLAEVVAELRR